MSTKTANSEAAKDEAVPADLGGNEAPAAPALPEVARLYGMTASYSPEDNKLRLRAARWMPRELYERFKTRGFIWAPKQELIVAPMWTPDRHDVLMEMCGEIGDEETTLTERSEQRADRFVGYRVNRTEDGNRAYDRACEIMNGIPTGEPILVGHHSQRRAERDAERIESSLGKAVIMWECADYWRARAAGVIRHANYKDRPDVRARRIETIQADKRKQERAKAKAEKELAAWNYEGMTAELAYKLAGMVWLTVYTDHEKGLNWTAYDVLRPVEDRPANSPCPVMTWEEVREVARRRYPAHIAYAERWINHCELRITYEKTILAAQGASHLLERKPRPKPLPLLNYRAPEGLTVKHYGNVETLPQVEMTSAEFQRIRPERRGTRFVDGSHRVRFALLGEGYGKNRKDAVIFLTDSKEHKRAEPAAAVEEAEDVETDDVERGESEGAESSTPAIEIETTDRAEPEPIEPEAASPAAALLNRSDYSSRLEAARETLKAGIEAVSAPQLFPTRRKDIAERVIEAAGIIPGARVRVLEPEAGTGELIKAIQRTSTDVRIVAVEIQPSLAEHLRARYSRIEVICADFLKCRRNDIDSGTCTIGEFDIIVANPPFTHCEDVKHVEHMLCFLPAGEGRIAAIMLNDGQAYRPELAGEPGHGRRAERVAALRALVESQGRTMTVEELPDDAFKSEGTRVRTVLVTIE